MRKIFIISIVFMVLAACEKENETIVVTYRASHANAVSAISYRNNAGKLVTEEVDFTSTADIWTKNSEFEKGDIVYLSGVYYDSIASLKLEILIDGKVFKTNSSVNEPEKYIIVSGSIPY